MQPIRVFVSSPGDVQLERQIARRVLTRLQSEFDELRIEPYFWEYEPMHLTKDFQTQIPRTSTFDIVVCVLWSRLGSPLGPQHHRPDGTPYQSGTEFEFEDAALSYRQRGVPDILVYRNRTDPPIKPRPKEVREQQLAQFDALETFLDRWTRDAEIFKGALTTYTDLGQFEELLTEHLRKLIAARCPAEATEQRTAATWTGSPFRGLEAFEFEHAPVFRGRTRAVQDVIALLRRQYVARQAWAADPVETAPPPVFVLVSAMSGIGKSSLVRAGVLPLLTAPGVIEGVGLWRRAAMKPSHGTSGLFQLLADALAAPEALPELLADGTSAREIAASLRAKPDAADLLVKGALSQAAAKRLAEEEAQLRQWEAEFSEQGRTADLEKCRLQRETLKQREAVLVLLVDQLEEVFSSTEKAAEMEREAFLAALDALARSGKAAVLATLRSDFFSRLGEAAPLAALTKGGALYQLEPPTPAELAQIIRDPAREAGLTFEEDPDTGFRLDDLLLAATQDDPAALPLLEFTLDQLHQRRGPFGLLTHRAYQELNGVEGALAKRAEDEYAALSPEARAAFGPVFGALVNLSDVRSEERPVRRRAATAGLSSHPGASEFMERLAEARLLVLDRDADGDRTISVVHEALFSHWSRLKDWIEHNRDLLRIRARVETAAARWQQEGCPRDLLLPDGRLVAEARELLGHNDLISLAPSVVDFIRQSATARKKRRRRRTAALAVLTAGIAVAFVVSLYQWQALHRNRVEAKLLEYQKALRTARDQFISHGPAPSSQQKALDASLRVFALADEIETLRGTPPDTALADAARVYEYCAILRSQMGDSAGSVRDYEARRALFEKSPGLDKEARSFRVDNPYAMTVFDLQCELMIANEHLKALLLQRELLDEALRKRGLQHSGSTTPEPSPVPAKSAEERARESLAHYEHMVRMFEFMLREWPRSQDFGFMSHFQKLAAGTYEDLQQWDDSRRLWEARVDTATRFLNWARTNSQSLAGDKERVANEAARALLEARFDLIKYHKERNEPELALAVAREALKSIGSEPELRNLHNDRFSLRQFIAVNLRAQQQTEAASNEIETGTGELLESSRRQLAQAWDRLAQQYRRVASARSDLGDASGAVEAARQGVTLLEMRSETPAGPEPTSELAAGCLNLSWYQLLAGRFADCMATCERALALPVDEEQRAQLHTNLAHALLLQGEVQRAREVYETWKDKPAGKNGDVPVTFAKLVLEDFDLLTRHGLTCPDLPAIRASMEAALHQESQQ